MKQYKWQSYWLFLLKYLADGPDTTVNTTKDGAMLVFRFGMLVGPDPTKKNSCLGQIRQGELLGSG